MVDTELQTTDFSILFNSENQTLFGLRSAYRIVNQVAPELLENAVNDPTVLENINEWMHAPLSDQTADKKIEELIGKHLFDSLLGLKMIMVERGKENTDAYMTAKKTELLKKLKE